MLLFVFLCVSVHKKEKEKERESDHQAAVFIYLPRYNLFLDAPQLQCQQNDNFLEVSSLVVQEVQKCPARPLAWAKEMCIHGMRARVCELFTAQNPGVVLIPASLPDPLLMLID